MKLAILLLFFHHYSAAYDCNNERTVTLYYKKLIYDFSIKLLDDISLETDQHFVSSPISAWLQLENIAEGAHGKSLRQISKLTGLRGTPCMQSTLKKILNKMFAGLSNYQGLNLVIVDKNLGVNLSFKRKLEQLDTVKVLPLNFYKPYYSASIINQIVEDAVGITDIMDPDDFNLTSLLLADVMKFKSAWSQPFDPIFTMQESFFYGPGFEGKVKMMSQMGRFKYLRVNEIQAEVIELPFIDEKHSMLVFLPTSGYIKDVFLRMNQIRIATLFNLFNKTERQSLNVRLPRFKMTSELTNLAELIHDMGVTYIFHPERSNLKGITKFPIQVNDMKQLVEIEVTEEGVSADVAQFYTQPDKSARDFIANKPFAFMLVDRTTEIILFAGIYSIPALY